jgi:hypothetical protein
MLVPAWALCATPVLNWRTVAQERPEPGAAQSARVEGAVRVPDLLRPGSCLT